MMNKKIAAVFMAMAMTAACITPVMAEEETTDLYVITFDEEAVEIECEWIEFTDGYAIYLPGEWGWMELTEEDEENGILLEVIDEEETAMVAIVYYTPDEMDGTTLADVYESYSASENYESVIYAVLNDIEVVMYDSAVAEDGTQNSGVFFFDEEGYAYEVAATPMNDEEYSTTLTNILISISTIAEEE